MNEGQDDLRAKVSESFFARQRELFVRTDRIFAVLMVVQWLAGILAAAVISPRTWAGTMSETTCICGRRSCSAVRWPLTLCCW